MRREILEQAVDIRLDLRAVLAVLGEVGQELKCLHEAEALSERLNDDRWRCRVSSYVAAAHFAAGNAEQALASCDRALEIAVRLGDLRLRFIATCFLELLCYYRGDYERTAHAGRTAHDARVPHPRGALGGL